MSALTMVWQSLATRHVVRGGNHDGLRVSFGCISIRRIVPGFKGSYCTCGAHVSDDYVSVVLYDIISRTYTVVRAAERAAERAATWVAADGSWGTSQWSAVAWIKEPASFTVRGKRFTDQTCARYTAIWLVGFGTMTKKNIFTKC